MWESADTPETAWQRIPKRYRDFVKENHIRVFILPGFNIAKDATARPDLQLRMQGNSFLGAFFAVSSFLEDQGFTIMGFCQQQNRYFLDCSYDQKLSFSN